MSHFRFRKLLTNYVTECLEIDQSAIYSMVITIKYYISHGQKHKMAEIVEIIYIENKGNNEMYI